MGFRGCLGCLGSLGDACYQILQAAQQCPEKMAGVTASQLWHLVPSVSLAYPSSSHMCSKESVKLLAGARRMGLTDAVSCVRRACMLKSAGAASLVAGCSCKTETRPYRIAGCIRQVCPSGPLSRCRCCHALVHAWSGASPR